MSALPHIIAGQPVTEEHIRVYEAWLREHDLFILRALAAPYASHPDFNREWWPE